jgi:hypothetical protein
VQALFCAARHLSFSTRQLLGFYSVVEGFVEGFSGRASEPGERRRRSVRQLRLKAAGNAGNMGWRLQSQEDQRKMKPIIIDCAEANWKVLLKRNLQEGVEVDLGNFDYDVDGVFCEILAMAHSMTLRYNSRTKSWLFKKQAAPFRAL